MKKLTTPRIFVICLGEFARAILGGLLVTYAMKFFNVTPSSGLPLLLPIGMIGLLRGIGVVFDAINDPWVASISDRLNNKNGGVFLLCVGLPCPTRSPPCSSSSRLREPSVRQTSSG